MSHSLPTVHTLCSEAIWMEDGAVREAGPAKEVVGSYLADVHAGIAEHAMEATGGRHGTGEAEITKVAFLDGAGAEASSFYTGDPFTIRLDYRIHDARHAAGVRDRRLPGRQPGVHVRPELGGRPASTC